MPSLRSISLLVLLGLGAPLGCEAPSSCEDQGVCLVSHAVSMEPVLAVADVDGDGRADALVVADRSPARVAVRRGQADGSFAAVGLGVEGPALPAAVAVGDADGDGATEVLLWWSDASGPEICAYALGPDGTLTSQWCLPAAEAASPRLVIGALGPAGEAGYAAWSAGEVQVVVDPARAATSAALALPITKDGTIPLGVADLDGDGRDALLWIADGQLQQFTAPWMVPDQAAVPDEIIEAVVADFDGDGVDDIALLPYACGPSLPVEVRRSSGGKSLGTFVTLDRCTSPIAADLDGDGRAELLAADAHGSAVLWGHALAQDDQVDAVDIDGPVAPQHGLIAADVDGDGLDDLMLTASSDAAWEGGYFPRSIVEIWLDDA